MNKDWVKLSAVAMSGAVVFYALNLVAGDNTSVVEVVKNFVQAIFAGAVVAN